MTSLRSAVATLLGDEDKLAVFVRTRRDCGLSWYRIAVELHKATSIAVSDETLRSWYPDEDES